MEDRDLRSENEDSDEEQEIKAEMESIYRFGFGEDWEELPTQDHRTLMRRVRTAGRLARKGNIHFDILGEYGEEELDELDWAASLAEARRRNRPRARRRGAPKPPRRRDKAKPGPQEPGRSERSILAPRPGPRR